MDWGQLATRDKLRESSASSSFGGVIGGCREPTSRHPAGSRWMAGPVSPPRRGKRDGPVTSRRTAQWLRGSAALPEGDTRTIQNATGGTPVQLERGSSPIFQNTALPQAGTL